MDDGGELKKLKVDEVVEPSVLEDMNVVDSVSWYKVLSWFLVSIGALAGWCLFWWWGM